MKPSPLAFRKLLLRVVYWALGLAAIFGATGIIFAGHDTLWRIVGTCAVSAGGALILLAASHRLAAESSEMPEVMAIVLILIEYLVALGLIWEFFGRAEEPMAKSMVFLAASGFPAILFSVLMRRPLTRISGGTGLVACGLLLVVLMIGDWGKHLAGLNEERYYKLGFSLGCFALLGVVCLVGAGFDRRYWRWLGVAAAGSAFLMSAYGILLDLHHTSTLFVCIVSAAAVVAHANAMAQCAAQLHQRWLLWGTVAAGIATGVFVDWDRLIQPGQGEMLGRMAGASAIVGGCGTLAILVLAGIQQRLTATSEALAKFHEVSLVCPRCQIQRTIALGSGKCADCGLVIEVKLR